MCKATSLLNLLFRHVVAVASLVPWSTGRSLVRTSGNPLKKTVSILVSESRLLRQPLISSVKLIATMKLFPKVGM